MQTSRTKTTVKSQLNQEEGFTLLELIISMVVFIVVTGAVLGTMNVARQSRAVVSENTGLSKNVRLALNIVGRDAYNAGYGYPINESLVILPDNRIGTLLGVPNDVDTSRDTVPPLIAGNNITLNTHNLTPNVRTDQVSFLFKDNTFNLVGGVSESLGIGAATTTSGGIDEIVPLTGGNSACRVNDLYLISGGNGSTLGLSTALSGTNSVQFGNSDLLGFNQTGTGPLRGITVPASMQRISMVTYFVTADGTLTRREFANRLPAVAFVDEPLIYGVENFQIVYIMDNGTVSDNPSAGPNGVAGDADDVPANLALVRQIRFTVSVRSKELNSGGQPYRMNQTTTFSTRNLGYDAN